MLYASGGVALPPHRPLCSGPAAEEEAAGGGGRVFCSCLALPGVDPLKGCADEAGVEAWLENARVSLVSPEAHSAVAAHFLFAPGPLDKKKPKLQVPDVGPAPAPTHADIPFTPQVRSVRSRHSRRGLCREGAAPFP